MDSFACRMGIKVDETPYEIYHLTALEQHYNISRLPFSIKILLENLLRHEDGVNVTQADIEAVLKWDSAASPSHEISFRPSRVLLQDFTGVPAVVDLAVMRDAMQDLAGDVNRINPLVPVELVIDHSVMVDHHGSPQALAQNTAIEFTRNQERYQFLRWGQTAFENFKVVPPGTGIVHQVNVEYLARVIFEQARPGAHKLAYPDTVVGTDSHTTMINGLGVLGWGVGGIEAEAVMLGQPITMLIPQVIGFKLTNRLPEGTTATDLVLAIVERLRQKGVVGKFVEFYGEGLDYLPLADRATIANMAPEYGATCGIFPIDAETIKFLTLSGRSPHQVKLIETYAKVQGLFRSKESPVAEYSDILELDLSTVIPAIAGPKRPQDRIPMTAAKSEFTTFVAEQGGSAVSAPVTDKDVSFNLTHGAVVIAAITSCTNTSNPEVMIAAGLLAKRAVEYGLKVQPWVKTSLAPGSQVVTEYLTKADLLAPLAQLGFNVVGYGCTTCIGNSGPLNPKIAAAIEAHQPITTAVLSGNRNFEGRIHPLVKNAYLASPPLVVAYALAGTMDWDFYHDPIGYSADKKPIYMRDLWPSQKDIQAVIEKSVRRETFTERYAEVFTGDQAWQNLEIPPGQLFSWQPQSTYIKKPPYFDKMASQEQPLQDIQKARVLLKLGDSVTTDHISPAGSIALDTPAAEYLLASGVAASDFNSYGSRRGNHEVMVRGTFANIRLKNQLAPTTEGGWTHHQPSQDLVSIFAAAQRYQTEQVPLMVLAGKEYGTGSSRDWAAKGPFLLGVRVVLVESYERIHRSNLIGMGILPLQFKSGESAATYALTGTEIYDFDLARLAQDRIVTVIVTTVENTIKKFDVLARIDTPKELAYYRHGGILQYALRQLL